MQKNLKLHDGIETKYLFLLMLIAYAFSFAIRMIWVYQFQDNPNFYWNGELMINTNDGYTWAAAAQNTLFGLHEHNPGIRNIWSNGTIFFTVLFTKITPFSLETVILYMPTVISSLVVIPIILIARLYKQSFWGFLAALLGSIAWSYYNRTMTGYYDTDMFSAMAPMFILYFLMKSTMDFTAKSALYAAIAIVFYPFLYDAGKSIVYAMGIMYAMYMMFYHREERTTYISMILVFMALVPLPIVAPFGYLVKVIILIALYFGLQRTTMEQKKMMIISAVLFLLFMYFGNVFSLISSKVLSYLVLGKSSQFFVLFVPNLIVLSLVIVVTYGILKYLKKDNNYIIKFLSILGLIFFIVAIVFSLYFNLSFGYVFNSLFTNTSTNGLHFYGVHQTIREAGQIPFKIFANRISGSEIGVLISFIGYVILVMRHRAFILALPLIGIGAFALWGGLRFTVYAVPVAAMSAVYLFHVITQAISDKKSIYFFAMSIMTAVMIYPNITHIIGYKVPTVLNKAEVQDLEKLSKISTSKDYTLTWWDYGYPVWFYSNTNTIIDGGKHQNDNFIISTIMQTSSTDLAANLSRLAVETYVDSNYSTIADTLFKNGEEDQKDPNFVLSELESNAYNLPPKTRDIFLYLPHRMMNIFPTVAIFGNLDLTTGKALRKIAFYPTKVISNTKGILSFRNGVIFDAKQGMLTIGKDKKYVKNFIITQNTSDGKMQLHSQLYHVGGEYSVVYMKSYGQFVIMDTETFKSMYVQMFMLGKYDKNLFELVVASPYSRIYKLKK